MFGFPSEKEIDFMALENLSEEELDDAFEKLCSEYSAGRFHVGLDFCKNYLKEIWVLYDLMLLF